MHILRPREEEQLLLPVKSFIFPFLREFKPQTNELDGQAGEFIIFFLFTFVCALSSSRRKTILQDQIFYLKCPQAQLRALPASGLPACSHSMQALMASFSQGEDKGPHFGPHYASTNSR